MNDLIQRLEAANKQLIGTAESHDAIKEAIDLIRHADEIVYNLLPVFEAARPLVLNLERLKDYAKARK